MSRISILKRSIRTAAAAVVFVSLLSPANANQPDAVSVFPDLPISATADHAGVKARSKSVMLTSRGPGLLRSTIGNRTGQTFPHRRLSQDGNASNSNSTRSWIAS
jgi:hypothetical protein